jgi:hypothetical protein
MVEENLRLHPAADWRLTAAAAAAAEAANSKHQNSEKHQHSNFKEQHCQSVDGQSAIGDQMARRASQTGLTNLD